MFQKGWKSSILPGNSPQVFEEYVLMIRGTGSTDFHSHPLRIELFQKGGVLKFHKDTPLCFVDFNVNLLMSCCPEPNIVSFPFCLFQLKRNETKRNETKRN